MEFLDDVPMDAGDVGGGDIGGTETAVIDQPEVELPDGEAGPVDGVEQPPDETEGEQPKVDGRTAADAIKKGLSKIREADPKLADLIRKEFFKRDGEVRQFREAFKTPADALAAKELLEVEGGAEQIAKNKEEADAYAAELAAFSEGRPEVIDNLARDYPDALPKLADYGLKKLQQINPEAYTRTASRIISNTLQAKGFTASMNDLVRIIADGGDGAQRMALELAKKLSGWIEGTDRVAQQQPERQEDDPREKALAEREAKLNKETETVKHEQIGRAATTRINSVLQAAMAPYFKGRTLTEAQKGGIYKEAFSNVSESLQGKADYQSKLKSLIKKGNIQDIARFVESNVKQIAGKAVQEAWKSRGFSGTAAKPTPRPAVPGAAETVAHKPDAAEIDWSKDPSRARFMGEANGGRTGEATLKGGKVVRWNWDAQ